MTQRGGGLTWATVEEAGESLLASRLMLVRAAHHVPRQPLHRRRTHGEFETTISVLCIAD